MIKSWTIHLEFHKGYWPKFYIFRTPRHGDHVRDGGIPGTLVACRECSGIGLLHVPDAPYSPTLSQPTPEVHHWYDGRCRECEADGSWCDNPHIRMPTKPVIDERCTTCGGLFDSPPCSKNPVTGKGGHTYAGGVTNGR